MSRWDDLLAATRPGLEMEIGAADWLLTRRSYARPPCFGDDDRMTVTVEFVRSGSTSDPRQPRPTPTREDT